MERWIGRVALVTGASAGIGAAACRALVRHGMSVLGCARSVDKIQAIAEEEDVRNSPGKLMAYKCDLTKESEILTMFDEIRKTHGRLDVCINNAGLSYSSPLLTGATAEWRNMLDVNVMALSICTREAVKLMREKSINDGQIIHISSITGYNLPSQDVPGATFYCGTKFMVRALAEGVRRELKALKSNIRIATISPGTVETQFFETFLKNDPNIKPEYIFSAMKCLQPDDIADNILYILRAPQHVEIHDIIVRPCDQPH